MAFEKFEKPVGQPARILPGDHDTFTDANKRSHYTSGCRHEACRAAMREYARERARKIKAGETTVKRRHAGQGEEEPAVLAPAERAVRVPALGASRRIQALMRAGHSPVQIARRSQIGLDVVWWLALDRVDDVAQVTHTRIDGAFRAMRTLLPEPMAKTKYDAERITTMCRELAIEHGWAGPFDWFDIDRDLKPKHTPSSSRRRATEATP